MNSSNNRSIYCFGETLWDIFQDEKKPGGAPLNVAFHLKKFGLDPKVISKVGVDNLGILLLDFIRSKGLDADYIQTDKLKHTGVVNVKLSEEGNATYDIVFPSAWDFIERPKDFNDKDFILIFGSLASRNFNSRETLMSLLNNAGLALFDVNFRAPHYTKDLIEGLLNKSNIVKINEDEIEIIGDWLGIKNGQIEDICEKLSSKYSLDEIIVTLGGDGAQVFSSGAMHIQPAFKIDVVDTVGSGDSFLASYLAHYLKGRPIEESLKMACATGAYVATQKGAVPDYDLSVINGLSQIE